MSNIFNQQLEKALTDVNSSLQQNELTQQNSVKASKLGLYYAHGLTSKCEYRLEEDQIMSKDAAEQNKVAAIGLTTTQNIVTASSAAVLDASSTTSTASATANSIASAAAALTNLYGSVATILAVANSLDKGSKIPPFVEKANKATKEAAKLAEEASLIALDLTSEAPRSRAAGVVTQAGVVKSNMAALQKSLSDTFSHLQEAVTEDMATISSAVVAEREQAGTYKTSVAEDNAIKASQAFMNKHVNNDLMFEVSGVGRGRAADLEATGDQFTVSFSAFNEQEDGVEIISEYRIFIVKEDDSVAFNTELAKSTLPPNYVMIRPSGLARYSQAYVTPDYINLNGNGSLAKEHKVIARDYNGLPVTRGVPYTFFVYVVYTSTYQSHYDDTNGLLSLPAPYVTLETSLPVVNAADVNMVFYQRNTADAVSILFRMPGNEMKLKDGVDLDALMEFRSFIFSANDKNAFARNKTIDAASSKVSALADDFRLKEESYLLAKQAYNEVIAQGASAAEIQQKKKMLDTATAVYQKAKADYANQVMVLDQLSQGKISDFYFDEEILEAVPVSDYIVAKRNNDLPQQLQLSLKEMAIEREEFKTRGDGLVKRLKELNTEVKETTTRINDSLAAVSTDESELNRARKELAELIAKLEAIHPEKFDITTKRDAVEFKGQLGEEQREQDTLLKEIIEKFDEVAEIESKTRKDKSSVNVNELKAELRKKNTEIVVLTAQQNMLHDELKTLHDHINMVSSQVAHLEKNKKEGVAYDYYEAVNEAGDFTDNYGEVLVTGNSYCAVILSAIKQDEPEAASLYQNRMSDFSSTVPFNLQQV